jgi:hypothetical protein
VFVSFQAGGRKDGTVKKNGKTPPECAAIIDWLAEGQAPEGVAGGKKVVQFNWRRHWKNKVAPHLNKELVQASLDLGMMLLDDNWRRGDPPYLLGREPWRRAVPGKLSWYRPWGRCHWIAFFSMAVGVLNYPKLDWRFVGGDLHTVPVGYGPDGRPAVVMDILLFEGMTAEESLALATKKLAGAKPAKGWAEGFKLFKSTMVPALRAVATNNMNGVLT